MTDSIKVSKDVVVGLDYTLTVDGDVIDASGDQPLEYLQGYRNIIPGLEAALEGMSVGEEKTVTVDPKDGYGELDPEGFFTVAKDQFPKTYELRVGMPLRVRSGDGRILSVRVSELKDDEVILDLNHPLAGKTLVFDTKIVSTRPGTVEELEHGGLIHECSSCGSSGGCSGSCC
ncbi:MAG TPA: peptidylprolyl isomerase [Bellilinea sp.]|nr:peptidylprolyl isomerase [Bellilinea sp.]